VPGDIGNGPDPDPELDLGENHACPQGCAAGTASRIERFDPSPASCPQVGRDVDRPLLLPGFSGFRRWPLVIVDQPATIGALPVAVARAAGHQVAYLPGLAMRRIADLYPGRAKTNARDAFIIADASNLAGSGPQAS
jgi:hypothetical protein